MGQDIDIGSQICRAFARFKKQHGKPPTAIILGVSQRQEFLQNNMTQYSFGGVNIYWSERWNYVGVK